jgi:hypothetical protein
VPAILTLQFCTIFGFHWCVFNLTHIQVLSYIIPALSSLADRSAFGPVKGKLQGHVTSRWSQAVSEREHLSQTAIFSNMSLPAPSDLYRYEKRRHGEG